MLDPSSEDGATPFHDEITFEELMLEATSPPPAVGGATDRLERTLAAVASLGSGLPLNELLNRLVNAAADLADARYGALTVLDREASPPLRLLFTHGISASDAAQLGDLPGGHGVFDPALLPRTMPDADGDPSRSDVSAGDPSTHVLLGVPVRVGDRVVGALHLTEKLNGSAFSRQDERVAAALAAAAGVAIENARLNEEVARRGHWVSAATALLSSEPDATALQIVADWARDLAGADAAWVVAGSDPARLRLRVVSGIDADPEAMAGIDFSTSLAHCAGMIGRPLKVKSLSQHTRAVDVSAALGAGPMGPGVVVPLRSSIGLEAVVTLAWRDEDDAAQSRHETLPALLAEQAPLVLHVARVRQNEQRLAVLEDRDRIARDLHDLVIQQLFAIGLGLQEVSWVRDPEEIARRLERTIDEIDATIRDIRRTIFSLGTSADDADPSSAFLELVERAGRIMKLRPTLQLRGPVRSAIGHEVLPDILAVLSEALSNVVRHAEASTCAVEVSVADEITVRVTDDGRGLPDAVRESGLANARERAQRRGGQLTVDSSPGVGTSLVWSIPLS